MTLIALLLGGACLDSWQRRDAWSPGALETPDVARSA